MIKWPRGSAAFGARGQHAVDFPWATAQPVMRIDDKGTPHYFFTVHDGVTPQFVFANGVKKTVVPGMKSTFTVRGEKGKVKVTVLT